MPNLQLLKKKKTHFPLPSSFQPWCASGYPWIAFHAPLDYDPCFLNAILPPPLLDPLSMWLLLPYILKKSYFQEDTDIDGKRTLQCIRACLKVSFLFCTHI